MTQAARTYGEIVHFRVGPSHAYLLTNPAHAHYVLAERPDLFTERVSVFRALNSAFGHDLFPPKDGAYRREAQRALFQPRWLDAFVPEIGRVADEALADWPADGAPDAAEIRELALRVVARVLFDATDTDIADHVRAAMTANAAHGDPAFPSPLTLPTRGARQRSQLTAMMGDILREQAASPERDGLLARLARAAAERGQGRALDAQAREEAAHLFLAAYEMTANTLAWALHLLAGAPETLEAVREEADRAFGDAPLTLGAADDLVMADMVVRETLRLYPPAWLFCRQAVRETRIGNYYLPSGSTLYVSPYITQRSPRYFVTPEAFIPERFASGYDRRMPRNAYMPFGAGLRAQLAQPVVGLQTRLLLAAVVRRFTSLAASPSSREQNAPWLPPSDLTLSAREMVGAASR